MVIGIEMFRNEADLRQGLQLDLGCVLNRLVLCFPNIEFEEEYFQRWIEIMRQVTQEKADGGKAAIHGAVRDAEQLGPRFSFKVPSNEGGPLKGALSRYRLTFRLESDTDANLRTKAEDFLRSFCINKLERDE